MALFEPDPDELALLRSLPKSKLWKYLLEYLQDRTLALIQETCTTDGQVWSNKGAMNEVQRLARAPEAVLKFYLDRQKQREDMLHHFNDLDPDRTLNGRDEE